MGAFDVRGFLDPLLAGEFCVRVIAFPFDDREHANPELCSSAHYANKSD